MSTSYKLKQLMNGKKNTSKQLKKGLQNDLKVETFCGVIIRMIVCVDEKDKNFDIIIDNLNDLIKTIR